MALKAQRGKGAHAMLALGAVLAVAILAAASRHGLAVMAGRFLAGVWISVMDVVLRLIAALFGH